MPGFPLLDIQLYSLFFLLGAFTVKSISEMENWHTRRNMVMLWLFFLVGFAIFDGYVRPYGLKELGVKWGMITGIAFLFYIKDIELIVWDDKIALLAAMAILPYLHIPLLLGFYVLLVWLFKTRLRHKFSHSDDIPTMPLITSSLIFTVLIFLYI